MLYNIDKINRRQIDSEMSSCVVNTEPNYYFKKFPNSNNNSKILLELKQEVKKELKKETKEEINNAIDEQVRPIARKKPKNESKGE